MLGGIDASGPVYGNRRNESVLVVAACCNNKTNEQFPMSEWQGES